MSTSAAPVVTENTTIKVVSHSMLFYWWPVWLVGFVLALLTYFGGDRLAIVPNGTQVEKVGKKKGDFYELTPPGQPTESLKAAAKAGKDAFPVAITDNKNYGILFTIVLLLVILITNVAMRGLWSVIVLLVVLMAAILLAAMGLWGPILEDMGKLHIYISAAGYLVISLVLLLFWLAVFFLYDQRRYMTFSPGQFIVHQDIGDLRQIHDTTNVTVEKRRSDLFRHWILGFGSGDLIVQTPGTQGVQLVLPNVLFAARRVQEIADLMKTRPVVRE